VAGFTHYRHVISVDGTFLTGKYKGMLMVAVSMTAKNQLLLLAFALVEGKNNENWKLFLGLVRKQVLGLDRQVYMISDRHCGLLNGAKDHLEGYPPLIHRWCSQVPGVSRLLFSSTSCANLFLSSPLRHCSSTYMGSFSCCSLTLHQSRSSYLDLKDLHSKS
jgi:hypothetical protein